jgi:hypothetical protein
MPWIDWHDSSDDAAGFTIHPDAIPAGDTFLIPYEFVATQRPDGSSGGDALSALGLIVPAVPSCVPAVGDGDISGVQAR